MDDLDQSSPGPVQIFTGLSMSDRPQLPEMEYATPSLRRWLYIEARKTHVRPGYMQWQDELMPQLRSQMVETIMYAGYHLRLKNETVYKAAYIIDAVMSVCRVQKTRLRLLTVTVLHIASKYEETEPPSVAHYARTLGIAMSSTQVKQMEEQILNKLAFRITFPSPTFYSLPVLEYASKSHDMLLQNMVGYVQELGLLSYDLVAYPPSVFAASAVCLAWDIVFKHEPFDLEWLWFASKPRLHACYSSLKQLVKDACSGAQWARIVHSKYGFEACSNAATVATARIQYPLGVDGGVGKRLQSLAEVQGAVLVPPGFDE